MGVTKKLLIAFAALVIVVSLVLALYVQSASRSWQRYLSDLRAAGEPVTFAEIQSRRSSIAAGNRTVADVVARVAERVKTSSGPISRGVLGMSDGPAIDFFAGIPSEAIETTCQYMAPRRPALEELVVIHDLEPGRFKISYDGPPIDVATRFIETSPPIQQLMQLLYLDATLHLIDGNTEAAAALIPKLFDAVSPLAEEPAWMAHLHRVSTADLAVRILENTLCVGSIRDGTLKDLDSTLAKYLDSYSVKWALWGDRAIHIAMFDHIRSTVGLCGTILFGATHGDLQRGAEMLAWLIEADDDPAKLLAARNRLEIELAKLSKTQMFTIMNLTPIPMLVTLHLRCLVEVRVARIAIAAERYRLASGEFPRTLDQLVPAYLSEIPVDPFDQEPMKLTHSDNGIVIYSVGSDANDDGGHVVPLEGEKQPIDRGFRLLAEQSRGLVFVEEAVEGSEE